MAKNLGDKAIVNRAHKIKELEAQKEAIELEIAALKDEIKSEMDRRDSAELIIDEFIFRYTPIVKTSVDSKKLKEMYEEIYNAVSKSTAYKTFRIDKNKATAKKTA